MQKKRFVPIAVVSVLFLASCGGTAANSSQAASSTGSVTPSTSVPGSSTTSTGTSSSGSSSASEDPLASSVYDYSSADFAERGNITGVLEKYLMDTHLSGVPLFDNGGYVEISNRLNLPVRKYITNYGFGTGQGTLDTAQTMYNGALDESVAAWKSYFHSYNTEDTGTFNGWMSTGQDVSDRSDMITSTYFTTKMNAAKDGYNWVGSLASVDRPIMIDGFKGKVVTDTSVKSSKFWRVPVHTGAGYTYATKSTKYAAYNGRQIALEDYLTPFKCMIDNKLKRATDIASNASGFAGVTAYMAAPKETRKWDDVGIQINTEANAIEFEYVTPKVPYYAMYDMTENLFSPLPMEFITAIGGGDASVGAKAYGIIGDGTTYTATMDNILSVGPYVPEYWQQNVELVYAKNASYYDAASYHYDGWTEKIIDTKTDDAAAYKAFLANQIDYVGIPSKYVAAHKSDANALHTYGTSVWKLNTNSCTAAQYDAFFGKNGSFYPHATPKWVVKPVMSNQDFLDACYFAINRTELANAMGRNAALGFLSDAYMTDPEQGLSYRNSDAGKAALKSITDVAADGYSLALAKTLFRNAMTSLVEAGSYTAGTVAEPKVIDISAKFFYDSMKDTYGAKVLPYINDTFNAACADMGFKLNLTFEVGGSSYMDTYDAMQHGEFDFAFGSISGSAMDPLGFMNTPCSDGLSIGFATNFGFPTAEVNPDHPITYDGKNWSYDALWSAAEYPSIVIDGKVQNAVLLKPTTYDDNNLYINVGTCALKKADGVTPEMTFGIAELDVEALDSNEWNVDGGWNTLVSNDAIGDDYKDVVTVTNADGLLQVAIKKSFITTLLTQCATAMAADAGDKETAHGFIYDMYVSYSSDLIGDNTVEVYAYFNVESVGMTGVTVDGTPASSAASTSATASIYGAKQEVTAFVGC